MRIFQSLVLLFCVCSMMSCSSDDDSNGNGSSISGRTLSGVIEGEEFIPVKGTAGLNEETNVLSFQIADAEYDCEDFIFNTHTYISADIDITNNEVQITNVVTSAPSEVPANDFNGEVQLISINGEEYTIRVKTIWENLNDTDVEGEYTVTLCPQTDDF